MIRWEMCLGKRRDDTSARRRDGRREEDGKSVGRRRNFTSAPRRTEPKQTGTVLAPYRQGVNKVHPRAVRTTSHID